MDIEAALSQARLNVSVSVYERMEVSAKTIAYMLNVTIP